MKLTLIGQELNNYELTENEARRVQNAEKNILERHALAAQQEQERLAKQDEELRQARHEAHLLRQRRATIRQQQLIGGPKRRFYISPEEGREMWELARQTLKKNNTDTAFAELMAMYAGQAVNPHLPIAPLYEEDIKKAPFIWLRMSPDTSRQWTELLAELCRQHPSFQHHGFTETSVPSRVLQVQGMSYLCQLHLENATTPT